MSSNGKRTGPVRAAIYCRLSVERPDQELSSVQVQRERCEQYAASQGWLVVPTRYDDDGFSGGNANRPALQRLLHDVEAGEIDSVVTVRIDRLSRSMIDFLRIMETLDRHGAALVSITQQIDSSTSWGRMVLNMLAGFGQFERDLISERTRDKVNAARRKGRWTGGTPVLGYDVHPDGGRLIVNEAEAIRVRSIFDLYLQIGSLSETARELARRGWGRKRWINRRGTESGGGEFTRATLHGLLTNPLYLGKVRSNGDLHDGEHDAIISQTLFDEVGHQLRSNGHKRASASRTRNTEAWLRGLLWCAHCDCPMTPSFTTKGARRYRYYICTNAQRQGWSSCPSPSVSAGSIEATVLDEIRDRITGTAWSTLTPTERHAAATRLLGRVTFDGEAVEITFAQREAAHA